MKVKNWFKSVCLSLFVLGVLLFALGMDGGLGELQELLTIKETPREFFGDFPGRVNMHGIAPCGDLGEIQYSYRMDEWIGDYIHVVQWYDYSSEESTPYVSVTKYGDLFGFSIEGEFTDVHEGITSSGIPYKEYSFEIVKDATLMLYLGDEEEEKRLDFDYIEECGLVK